MVQTPKLGGMVGKAQDALKDRGYQLHVQEMQAQGLAPLPYDQWAAQQGKK